MKVSVVINRHAGGFTDSTRTQVASVFAAHGVSTTLKVVESSAFNETARAAAADGPDILVVGGGDGTVSQAAAIVAGTGQPLGLLPVGTLNNFARHLKIPADVEEAVGVITANRVREVDLGSVNGRPFINNSSIGFYPWLVNARDERMAASGSGKWPAMLKASTSCLWHFPLAHARIVLADRYIRANTPFVFFGNNEYRMDLRGLGTRESLDAGQLSLYLPRRIGRRGLTWLVLRGLSGRLEEGLDFQAYAVTEARVETAQKTVDVAIDGEVVTLPSPLLYATRPRALRVVVPGPAV